MFCCNCEHNLKDCPYINSSDGSFSSYPPYTSGHAENCEHFSLKSEIVSSSLLKDSGARVSFDSGATRDIQPDKGRCDLLPIDTIVDYFRSVDGEHSKIGDILEQIYRFIKTKDVNYIYSAVSIFVTSEFSDNYTAILELSKHFQQGANKYGERNWEKGIPLHSYIDSGVRHLLKYYRKDEDERHDRAFIWNMLCGCWTLKHYPELDDIHNIH